MIVVNVKYNHSSVCEITITGHANYADFGKDIVCSSVSSIVITTVNGIDSVVPNFLTVEEKKDQMKLIVQYDNEIGQKLLWNMIELLKELQVNYPKNIIVK